ncbi:MAG TPA: BsuPI-related putative proteinase inhibitor [Chthonomonadaceae bacterium]|nr:BsuPI-related putative proteinase inhibitor [Chthonomonadaceae bacterium]
MRYEILLPCACGAVFLLMAASGVGWAQTSHKKPARPGQGIGPVSGSARATRPSAVEIVVPVALSVRTDKKIYRSGAPIQMTITVKNATKDPVRLTFPTGQRYDIDLRRGSDPKNPKIWQWSHGQMFTQMVSSVSLPPGKALSFSETYRPGQEQAPVLTPGTYTFTATLMTMGHGNHPFGTTRITVR